MSWRSIEFRLTAWCSLLLFMGYVIFSVALWLTVRRALVAAVEERLTDRVQRLVQVVTADAEVPEEVEEELIDYVTALPESYLTQVRDGRDRQLVPPGGIQSTVIPWKSSRERVFFTVETETAPYHVLQQEVSLMGQPYKILLASSLESLVVVRDRLAASFLIATPLALVLCSGGGFYIARRALTPVDQIAETASDITVSNLSKRIPIAATHDALERLSRTFNEMLERLETSVARIEQFSADASHELRTPISVIRTTAELALRHGRTEAEYRADLNDIHAEAQRLSDLIEVLLTLARNGWDSCSVPMTRVDLVPLVAGVCRQFEREAESKGLALKLEAPEGSVVLKGNEPSLRRLLASLLENALAHTQAGRITVSVERDTDVVHLRVRDTGEGIPAEALGRVFDRFYRVDSSRSRSSGRLGLGLSIAQRIAELHNAELTVRSQEGEGSEFSAHFRTVF